MSVVPLTPGYPAEDPSQAKTAYTCFECGQLLFLDIHLYKCEEQVAEQHDDEAENDENAGECCSDHCHSVDAESNEGEDDFDEDEWDESEEEDEPVALKKTSKPAPKAPSKPAVKVNSPEEDDDEWDDEDEEDEDEEDEDEEDEGEEEEEEDEDEGDLDEDDFDEDEDEDEEKPQRGYLRKLLKAEREAAKASGEKKNRRPPMKSRNWRRNEFLKKIADKKRGGYEIKCQYFYTNRKMRWMEQQKVDEESKGRLLCPNKACNAKIGRFEWSGIPCDCGEWKCPGFQFLKQRVMTREIKPSN